MALNPTRSVSRSIALSGAWLFSVGLITGIWVGMTATGSVQIKIPHLALAAHLNALLGGLWLLAVATTAPYLSYDDRGMRRLARWIEIPSWGNWFFTLLASILGVRGLGHQGQQPNDAIAYCLQIGVVLPSFVGAFLWLRGFYLNKNKI